MNEYKKMLKIMLKNQQGNVECFKRKNTTWFVTRNS